MIVLNLFPLCSIFTPTTTVHICQALPKLILSMVLHHITIQPCTQQMSLLAQQLLVIILDGFLSLFHLQENLSFRFLDLAVAKSLQSTRMVTDHHGKFIQEGVHKTPLNIVLFKKVCTFFLAISMTILKVPPKNRQIGEKLGR